LPKTEPAGAGIRNWEKPLPSSKENLNFLGGRGGIGNPAGDGPVAGGAAPKQQKIKRDLSGVLGIKTASDPTDAGMKGAKISDDN